MKFIYKIILLINFLFVIGILLAYLSPYFNPNEYWIFSIFGLFYPVLLLLNVGMVLFWMVAHFKYLFFSLVAILIGWSHLQGFININSHSDEPGDITIMSYNTGFFWSIRKGNKADNRANRKKVINFFQSNDDVDVFCIQESSEYSRQILKKAFPNYYPHEISQRGTFIYSRFPIGSAGQINFGTSTNSCLWADLKLPTGKIRVYCAHLQSNAISKEAVEVMDNADIQDKETWNGIGGIINKYKNTTQIRAKQAMMIADHAEKCTFPTMIIGDVNDPPTSYTYSRICSDYQDSFVEAGAGIGTTYGGRIPMLRIDYIFAENAFTVEKFEILKERYSDHYPIKGVYSLSVEED